MRIKVIENKKNLYVIPVVNMILGLFIVIFKEDAIRWTSMALGAIVVVVSIMSIVVDARRKTQNINITIDAIMLGAGLLMLLFAGFLVAVIRIFLGVFLIIHGLIKVLSIFDDLSPIAACMLAVEAILYIVSGIFLFMNKHVLYYALGGAMILNGALDLIYNVYRAREFNKRVESANAKKNSINVEPETVHTVENN